MGSAQADDVRARVREAADAMHVEIGQVYEHIGALSYKPRWPDERLPGSGHRIRITQVAGENRKRTTRFVLIDPPIGGNGRRDRQDHEIQHIFLARGYRLVDP